MPHQTSSVGNTKTSRSSSAVLALPDANHAKEAYTENHVGPIIMNQLASLMVSWGNQMNQLDTKKSLMKPLPCLSVGCRTITRLWMLLTLPNGNSSS